MADERLINKGRSVALADLLAQGNTSVGAARKHATELSPCGWTQAKTVLLEDLLAQLGAQAGAGRTQTEDARTKTRHEAAARENAKTLLRKLQEGLKILHREGTLGDLTLASFSRKGKPLRSTADLSAYLLRIEPLVAKLDATLGRFFGGHQPSELVRGAVSDLQEADRAQENARQALPGRTVERTRLKGRVLDLIDELNGVARIAFDDRPELRAKFNKDHLRRTHRARPAAPAADTPVEQ
ncbi:hypothetical protein KKD52_18955 [Myxococcota bacterium]|nr:hypothetical protein [Myxococcota bacterium]MBU1512438.1 hypothetical protein [Myxococcota bacterium]